MISDEILDDLYGFIRREMNSIIKKNYKKRKEQFFRPFTSFFPRGELQKTLPREGMKFVDGSYTFKVTLGKDLWRRIEISADNTLLDLHNSIQDAYDFDDDHLYSFFLDGKPWSHEKFTAPLDVFGPHVNEVRIGELGLFIGQKILYLFDYGDQWCFLIKMERIDKNSPKPFKPKIVERRGKNPEQYC